MSDVFVEFKNVSKVYSAGISTVEALKDATCSVRPKDRIAVVGASGSGKSTLLQIMGELDSPTSGTVLWPSFNSNVPLRPKQIGFVFQMSSLLPTLNVLENIELPLLLMDKDKDETRLKALEILDQIELSELKDKLPDELSGGQLQRVAVARILASRPKLILADEPTGQLDHPTAQKLLDVLLRSIENSDTAVVMATHDAEAASRMDTAWKIHHGILEVENR